jgi:hypothetical protein
MTFRFFILTPIASGWDKPFFQFLSRFSWQMGITDATKSAWKWDKHRNQTIEDIEFKDTSLIGNPKRILSASMNGRLNYTKRRWCIAVCTTETIYWQSIESIIVFPLFFCGRSQKSFQQNLTPQDCQEMKLNLYAVILWVSSDNQ